MPDGMRSQIAPPPHLNINNTAYFPRFAQNGGYGMGDSNTFYCPPNASNAMTFNYNMNIYMNPNPYNYFYNLNPYGQMNPWIEYLPFQPPINPHFQKMDQTYFPLPSMYHQKPERPYPQFLELEEKHEERK